VNTDWTGIYTCKECHKTESRWNRTTTDHKEGEQLEDRRNVGQKSCKSGDGKDHTGPILDVSVEDNDDDDDEDDNDDDDDDGVGGGDDDDNDYDMFLNSQGNIDELRFCIRAVVRILKHLSPEYRIGCCATDGN